MRTLPLSRTAALLAAAALAAAAAPAHAAKAKAGSGLFASRSSTKSGSNTWRFSTPDAGDLMIWTSGDNEADGKIFPKVGDPAWTEFKFNLVPGGPPAGKALIGFGPKNDTGPRLSVATTQGSGFSAAIPGMLWGTNYTVNWTVEATGTLGLATPHSYKAIAEGRDPFSITPAKLAEAGVSGSAYDLFIPCALEAGTASGGRGSFGLKVSYETAAGSVTLLEIQVNGGAVSVTNDAPAGLSIYALSSVAEGPTEIAANLTSLAAIQAALTGDMTGDMDLDLDHAFGLVLDDQPIPGTDMGDGSVAKLRVESVATESNGGCDLYYDVDVISASQGGVVNLYVEPGGAVTAPFRTYLLLGSASGHAPGIPLPNANDVWPINWDSFTSITLGMRNSPFLPNTMGVTDAGGKAVCQFNTLGPLPPAVVGMKLTFAYALFQPLDYASDWAEITIVP